jgi:hypothetical protein
MNKYIFYSGQECCLCDDALALLAQTHVDVSQLTKIDVKSDPQIYHLYGARIPVLLNTENQHELAWPFDLTRLTEFVS